MNTGGDFNVRINAVRAFLQRGALTIARVEAVKHFKQSFRDEGFTDAALTKWPDITDRRKVQKQKRNGNLPPILTDTGELGNSITGTERGRSVIIRSDKDYAQRHNEGLKGMPKRQFMGPSRALDAKIARKLDAELRRRLGF